MNSKMQLYSTNYNNYYIFKIKIFLLIVTTILNVHLLTQNVNASIIYVSQKEGAWYDNIQSGIDASKDGDEVIVREGVYKIQSQLDFNGKAITLRSESGPERTTISCFSCRAFFFHNNEKNNSVLKGFKITSGYSYPECSGSLSEGYGGAIRIKDSSPLITGNNFSSNQALTGGAISIEGSSNPTISYNNFHNNFANMPVITCSPAPEWYPQDKKNYCFGGAICIHNKGKALILNNFFSRNFAYSGGGIFNDSTEKSIIKNNIFTEHCILIKHGGGIYNSSNATDIINNVFNKNYAEYGGGIYNSSSLIINNTFYKNHASYGGGIYTISSKVINNILWKNMAISMLPNLYYKLINSDNLEHKELIENSLKGCKGNQIYHDNINIKPKISYSIIQECGENYSWDNNLGDNLGGNIDKNPILVDPENLDFRLSKSSPAIDNGKNISSLYQDIRGSLRPIDGSFNINIDNNFDIGAYEYSGWQGNEEDEKLYLFSYLNIGADTLYTDYKYTIHWKTYHMFPKNDIRIVNSYKVNIALISTTEKTNRKDIKTIEISQNDNNSGNHQLEIIFSDIHIGKWYILLELDIDPQNYILTPLINIKKRVSNDYIIGMQIEPPDNANLDFEPDIQDKENIFSWNDKKLVAIGKINNADIVWFDDFNQPIPIKVSTDWPELLFKDIEVGSNGTVYVDYDYSISWKTFEHFSGNDDRILNDKVPVKIEIESEERKEIIDARYHQLPGHYEYYLCGFSMCKEWIPGNVIVNYIKVDYGPISTHQLGEFLIPAIMPEEGHSIIHKFNDSHKGKWRLKITWNQDTKKHGYSPFFKIKEPDNITYDVGEQIQPPLNTDIEPEYAKDFFYWDKIEKKIYAKAPVSNSIIKWKDNNDNIIPVNITNVWPKEPQIYIAGSPAVNLIPKNSKYNNVAILYHTPGNIVLSADNNLKCSNEAYILLAFSQDILEKSPPKFKVIKSVSWQKQIPDFDTTWDIGKQIVNNDHNTYCGGGYIFNEISPYIVNTSPTELLNGYKRDTREGPIYPINKDDIVIIWYDLDQDDICWPSFPIRYKPQWPEITSEQMIIVSSGKGTSNDLSTYDNLQIYNQPNLNKPGYNPNEEHAVEINKTIYALRNDLNRLNTSEPYVFIQYQNPKNNNQWEIKTYKVIDEMEPYFFKYSGTAGDLIQAPYPLSTFMPVCKESYGIENEIWWEDYKGNLYAKQKGNGSLKLYYRLQDNFYYDLNGDGKQDVDIGDCIPLLDHSPGSQPGTPIDIHYTINWPESPKLHIGETLIKAKKGLPEIKNQCSVEIIYDESGNSVKLMEVITQRFVTLDDSFTLPLEIRTKEKGNNELIFLDLPPHLINRISYNKYTKQLLFKGIYNEAESLLLLNVMTENEKNIIQNLDENNDNLSYQNAIKSLYFETKKYTVGEKKISGSGEGLCKILTAAGPEGGAGFVTLAFNNDEEMCKGNMVSLEVILVDCDDLYTGELKIMKPKNVFDERIAFVHSCDFGGETENIKFSWMYKISNSQPPTPDENSSGWLSFKMQNGLNHIIIGGAGIQLLEDKWITCRYQGYNRCDGPLKWSSWTKPQLYENWVKRVTSDINAFEQRYNQFYEPDGDVATYVSMIQQAGKRYQGNIALNYDKNNLDSMGLIECYETILSLAKRFSINGTPPTISTNANNAILFATSRLVNLYMLLGNEAYADASDPTIGFTTDSVIGNSAASIFCFQNQTESLLQEELELLRGRDDSRNPDTKSSPVNNKLIWNFTGDNGQVAYVMNYSVESESDAKKMYPQGHGDAWGYYLTAIKKYYDLLRHPNYSWQPMTEHFIVAGTPVEVDYFDELKFAIVSAAKAKTGVQIINLTYRNKYVDNPSGQWQGYKDSNPQKAWGLSEWAVRVGQGTYFDWLVSNAILPEKDINPEHIGIRKIDRHHVYEIHEIASKYSEIQSELDNADIGLNPLGMAKNTIPFDISPAEVDKGHTHFEQIYNKAVQAINNAIAVFNYANKNTQMLRRQQESLENFIIHIEDQESDFNCRLIEVFGYPYSDDIGPGCTYPSGYDGPDIYHYAYVEPSEFMKQNPGRIKEFNIPMRQIQFDENESIIEQTKDVTFHVASQGFGLIKPSSWSGSRKAIGEIQMARHDVIETVAQFEKGLIEYNNLIGKIENEAKLLELEKNLSKKQVDILYGTQRKKQSLNDAIFSARKRQLNYKTIARMATIIANAIAESFPSVTGVIAGFSCGVIADATSPARSAVMLGAAIRNEILTQLSDGEAMKELAVHQAKEILESQSNIELTTLNIDLSLQQKFYYIEELIRREASSRIELFTIMENIQQVSDRYIATLAKGERILKDLNRFRLHTADKIREERYKDMTFRIFRNDALQKYHAQFNFAAKYVFMAAKAYDYDTCLLNSEDMSGERFYSNIIKQRTIGELSSGIPMTGSGLAEVMAKMYQNFSILKSKLGFNNPQKLKNIFSLRKELFRIKSNDVWKQTLIDHRVDNLLDIPEFRKFCKLYDYQNEAEPGIVIQFPTNITSKLNFFGWPLGGGDSSYDSAQFATKIRGINVWFSNYDSSRLSKTPWVYLIPVGDDIIRVPLSNSMNTRSFNVIDQILSEPFSIHTTDDLSNSEIWIPVIDTVPDNYLSIRKHPRFIANHDDIGLWENELIYNTNLIGRSVWNTKWMFVLPGATLASIPNEGLDIFIDNITDIKLLFETYSYSGM